MVKTHIERGDITTYAVDAIVNAANNELVLGGGVAGSIARAGGPDIQAACDLHGPVAVGEAAVTTGGNLPAGLVIHQASMRLGGRTTAEALKSSTEAVLRLAEANGVRTLAFPAVGTGIAGFDVRQCARIMLDAVRRHRAASLTDVYFVLFDEAAYEIFRREAQAGDDLD